MDIGTVYVDTIMDTIMDIYLLLLCAEKLGMLEEVG